MHLSRNDAGVRLRQHGVLAPWACAKIASAIACEHTLTGFGGPTKETGSFAEVRPIFSVSAGLDAILSGQGHICACKQFIVSPILVWRALRCEQMISMASC